MKTDIKKQGDTIVVSMEGIMDFEVQDTLREDLNKLIRNNSRDSIPKKIIFNLENLQFVGSSGISSFVQTLKEINNKTGVKPRYCNVKSEFRRVMKALNESDVFEFYDNLDRAKKSFDQ